MRTHGQETRRSNESSQRKSTRPAAGRRFSRVNVMLLLVAGVLLSTATAWGDTQVIPVLIRDLSDTHVDFEAGNFGSDLGFVSSTIGGDGTPVYIGGAGTPTTHGGTAFYDWYHDTAATAGTQVVNLTLNNNVDPAVYVFDSTAFFPIDGALGGNQGRSHNYHFTMAMNTSFSYELGQSFSFTGDDDLFVFIDGELVIDLGGVWTARTASVDLDTLGLTEGNSYSFDLFFAERHTAFSVMHMETGIEFVEETGDLTIVKFRDDNENQDFEDPAEPTLSGWDFRIEGSGVNQVVTTGPDGSVTIALDPGTYSVTEINIPTGWFPTGTNPLTGVVVTSGQETQVFVGNIPEPTTMAVLVLGGIGALVRRRRRKA